MVWLRAASLLDKPVLEHPFVMTLLSLWHRHGFGFGSFCSGATLALGLLRHVLDDLTRQGMI